MNNFVCKSVGYCARIGRLCLPPMRFCSQSTAGALPERLPFRGLPFMLVAGALLVSFMSYLEIGIFAGRHIGAIHSGTSIVDNQSAAASSSAYGHGRNGVYESSSHSLAAGRLYSLSVQSSQELINQLKEFRLWNDIESEIPPVMLNSFPADLKHIDVDVRKKAFLRALLPSVMVVQAEVRQERQELLRVIDEIGEPAKLKFSAARSGWQEGISQAQVLFINDLCKKYRTRDAVELLARVNVLPTSLMLAQAAIESSWGSSRFSIQANNLFGMWTWGKKGLVPARREAGKSHKIAIYDSIADSVRSYLLTINRLGAYSDLREIRRHTMDSEAIADGLINYSGRKEAYVASLKRLMRHNNLAGYDRYRLASPLGIGTLTDNRVVALGVDFAG